MQLIRLAQLFANSRLGKICGWISCCSMAWLAIASLANLVLRRDSGYPIDFVNAVLLFVTFFAVNASRTVYVTFSLSPWRRVNKSI